MPSFPLSSTGHRPLPVLAIALAGSLAGIGSAQADGMSAANRAHLAVADANTLGYYVYVDPACALGEAAVGGLMQGVMSGRGLTGQAEQYSTEGLNLELSLSCMDPDQEGIALFSVDAAFSLVQTDESDLLVNHTYGTYGEGDLRFISGIVLEVIQEALNDFDHANARIDAPAAATPPPAIATPPPAVHAAPDGATRPTTRRSI